MSRLHEIAGRAGGEVRGAQALIPGPGHSKRDRSLSLTIGERGQVVWHSFAGNEWRDVGPYLAELGVDLGGKRRDREEIDAERNAHRHRKAMELEEKRAIARALLAETQPIAGTVGEAYLRSRGLDPVAALRFHPRAPFTPYYPDSRRWPAMVGEIANADGETIGVHLTFLKRDGIGKAPIEPSRKVIGSQKGGAIWLGEASASIVVAEGIETALSVSRRCGLPAVAAISAGNLAAFAPPAGVCGALVAFDRDPHGVGERDARALVRRLEARGVAAVLAAPPASYSDWNEPDQERGQ